MKTYALLALTCVTAALACGCGSESLCERVECGSGGDASTTDATGSTETGAGSTESTSASQPTSSSTDSGSSGGGDGGASGSSSSSESGGGAGGEGGGGAPPGCELVDGQPVTGEDCAIFVRGDHDGDELGTRSAPYKTIAQAVAVAGNQDKAIYVCAVGYTETIAVTESMRLVGGFGCETWTWTEDGRTPWTAEADAIPLRVTDGASVSIANFAITADDADPDTDGGSSIAVLVAASDLTLTRSDLVAGNGSDGAEGAFLPGADPAPDGNDGNDGCSGGNTGLAVDGGANECEDSDRGGGLSGQGTTTTNGGIGSPGNPEEPGVNVGGARQTSGTSCTNGGDGSDGDDGEPGIGAVGLGQLTATGFIPESGSAGTSGTPGFGGGGGGGGRVCANSLVGPSGGGGGAGGCGGVPGAVGNGGGSSIALALVNATVTFEEATIAVGSGGRGGNGAPGQPGQQGGGGGQDGNVEPSGQGAQACLGGPGGDGGNGGPGGGGRGGHAFGIAWSGGNAPSEDGVTFAGGGNAGDGGERVDLALEGRGFDGIEEEVFEID